MGSSHYLMHVSLNKSDKVLSFSFFYYLVCLVYVQLSFFLDLINIKIVQNFVGAERFRINS